MTTDIDIALKEANDTSIKFTHEEMDETQKYLTFLKATDRKAYNKYRKPAHLKFSNTIMKRLK